MPGSAISPAIEAVLTMAPPPAARMWAISYFIDRNTPLVFNNAGVHWKSTVRERAAGATVLSREEFAAAVRDAYKCLHRPAELAANPRAVTEYG
ncbi:hypothetical protein GCM10023214_36080 [Amycolatopsis dongchuanensis]|uniref:Uncharacterized protein n=1 Tax=Amycolatopsis dongchuanensis TaxID=1070866 RepID=A0ABP9QPH9_9PSEU